MPVSGDGEVIAGHGRILAAEQLGLSKVPVIVLDHLTEAQQRAYRIADHRPSLTLSQKRVRRLASMQNP